MLAIYLAVGVLAADCSEAQSSSCGNAQCETLGTTQICIQCKANGNVPIDGACVLDSEAAANCKRAGGSELDGTTNVCGECSGKYFLHKGGCYSTDAGKPGRALCTAAGEGVCTQGAEGYFAVPGAVKTGESVVACDDATTGVQVNGGATYKGVQNCATCNAPQSAASGEKKAICTACLEGFFGTGLGADGATCTACQDDNCATCQDGTNTKKCSKCKATGTLTYLRKEDSSETGICVDAATCTNTNTYYTDDTEPKMCKKCSESLTNCEQCTSPSSLGSSPACTKCATPNYLKTAADGTTTCIEKTACKDDFFPKEDNSNGHKCLSCGDETSGVPNCVKCTAPSQEGQKPACSECASGFNLEGETCVSSSANRSALSTGAIAGISVAAVVVVGGLVGFLCWWFVYRGKA
ncbi:Variant-specific surface protein [Giardia duodenalis]|uniref:Variant-specific surface protein n=1 Tax=Giardia intestinalis TaxID=5741 RepID=V6TPF5_GIAIN|nr:Variant-specific surface protein [Giardia intestinalis]